VKRATGVLFLAPAGGISRDLHVAGEALATKGDQVVREKILSHAGQGLVMRPRLLLWQKPWGDRGHRGHVCGTTGTPMRQRIANGTTH
jgi:hypothetical protein